MKYNPLFPVFLSLLPLTLSSTLPASTESSQSSSHLPPPSPVHFPTLEFNHFEKQEIKFLKSFCLSFGLVLLPSIGNTIYLTLILLSKKWNEKAGIYLGTLCAQFALHCVSVTAGASLAIILHHKVINAMAVLVFTFLTFFFIISGCRRRHAHPKQALLYTKHLLEVKGFLQTQRPRQNSTESIVLYGIKTRDVEVSPMVLTPVPEALEEPLLPATGQTKTLSIPIRPAHRQPPSFRQTSIAFDHFLRQRRRNSNTDRRHFCVKCWDKSFCKCFCITLALYYLSAEQFGCFMLAASIQPLGTLVGGFVALLCSKGLALCWGASLLHQASPKLLVVVCGMFCAFITAQYFMDD